MKPRFWFNFQPGSPSRLYSTEKIWPHFFGLQDPSSLSDYSASLKKRRNTRKNNANLCIKEENLLLITDHSLLLFTFLFVHYLLFIFSWFQSLWFVYISQLCRLTVCTVAEIISHKVTQRSLTFLPAPGPSNSLELR